MEQLHDEESGQALPLVLVVLALAAVLMAGAVRLGAAVHDRALAQATADAAALAGAEEGRAAAERLAADNDGELVAFVDDGASVRVEIRRHGRRASAAAAWVPGPRPSEPDASDHPGVSARRPARAAD